SRTVFGRSGVDFMTAEQEEGQVIILLVIGLSLAMSLSWTALGMIAEGTDLLTTQLIMLLIQAALCCWLYFGGIIAKWIFVVFYGLGGACNMLSGLMLSLLRDAVKRRALPIRMPPELSRHVQDAPVLIAFSIAFAVLGLTIAC